MKLNSKRSKFPMPKIVKKEPEAKIVAPNFDSVLSALLRSSEFIFGYDQHKHPILAYGEDGKRIAIHLKSRKFRRFLRKNLNAMGITPSEKKLDEAQERCIEQAHLSETELSVAIRVASRGDGIELDLGDIAHTRYIVDSDGVREVAESKKPFHRPPTQKPFVPPAEKGDIKLLINYLNLTEDDAWLLICYISYTLGTPKNDLANYPPLILLGGQGTGKSYLCNPILKNLIDPSSLGLQAFPSSKKDLVLMARNSHLVMLDNVRMLSPAWHDLLCIMATGGSLSTRELYTDDEIVSHRLHGALVINGVHDFIEHSDLAQRCLKLEMLKIDEKNRLSEKELSEKFTKELPSIFRGLLNLMAEVFKALPTVKVIHPERMIDFVRWIAAVELVQGFSQGSLQSGYSRQLKEAQYDSIMADPLAEAIQSLITGHLGPIWEGTPSQLLDVLSGGSVGQIPLCRNDLPRSPISLSKRLKSLKGGLLSQGIEVEFKRSQYRAIKITNLKEF